MGISYKKAVSTIHPDGKVTTALYDPTPWQGCHCVYPGSTVCHCPPQSCPCNKVSATRHQRTDRWDQPFK